MNTTEVKTMSFVRLADDPTAMGRVIAQSSDGVVSMVKWARGGESDVPTASLVVLPKYAK
jgi:hypothetical protein